MRNKNLWLNHLFVFYDWLFIIGLQYYTEMSVLAQHLSFHRMTAMCMWIVYFVVVYLFISLLLLWCASVYSVHCAIDIVLNAECSNFAQQLFVDLLKKIFVLSSSSVFLVRNMREWYGFSNTIHPKFNCYCIKRNSVFYLSNRRETPALHAISPTMKQKKNALLSYNSFSTYFPTFYLFSRGIRFLRKEIDSFMSSHQIVIYHNKCVTATNEINEYTQYKTRKHNIFG